MKLSTKNSLFGKLMDSLGINKTFHAYSKINFNPKDSAFISPVEAKVVHMGKINSRGQLVSKNNKKILLKNILSHHAKEFVGGNYINLYLNPGNKHFWVTPQKGKFIYTQINRGKSWFPLIIGLENILGIEMLSRAIKHNASIASVFQTKNVSIAMIAVGSLNVNRIHVDYQENNEYEKGTPCGYFSMGSTMILCFPKQLNVLVKIGQTVQIGQSVFSKK